MKLNNRMSGLLLIATGLGFAYFFAYLPLSAAKAHDPSISIHTKWVMVAPAFVIIGALFAISGERATDVITRKEGEQYKLRIAGWVLVIISVGVGYGVYEWITASLARYGYR